MNVASGCDLRVQCGLYKPGENAAFISYTIGLNHATCYAGRRVCSSSTDLGKKICEADTGKKTATNGAWIY